MRGVLVEEPPLASLGLYPYLHKDHEELAAPLAEALEAMRGDGSFQAIYDEAMRAVDGQ